MNSTKRLIGAVSLAFLLAACGGGGGAVPPLEQPPVDTPPIEQPNFDPPALTLLSTSPAADAQLVDTTATVVLSFSTVLSSSSVNSDTVGLVGPAGTVATQISVDDDQVRMVPSQPLALLSRYEVQLGDGLKGNQGQSFVGGTSSFTTRDGLWGGAGLIDTLSTGDSNNPKVSVNAKGQAFAVWKQNANPERILAQRYNPSTGTWDPAAAIDTAATGTAANPEIAVDAAGNAFAVWSESDGTSRNIMANRFNASTGAWGNATLLEKDIPDASLPQIGVDGSGNAIAVWSQFNGNQFNIMYNRYSAPNNAWRADAAIVAADAGGDDARGPRIAVDSIGNALVVWRLESGVRNFIYSNSYNAQDGSWSLAQPIERPGAGGESSNPQVSVNSAGLGLATWAAKNGDAVNIWASRYSPQSGWGVASLIEADDTGDTLGASVAVDGAGNAVAVWLQSDGLRKNVWANHFTASSNTWGSATLVETQDSSDASIPQVAVDPAGNAIAVWGQGTLASTADSIFASRYNASTKTWGSPELLETQDGAAAVPRIAVDGLGRAVAVWTQSDGNRVNVVANNFR
jgi:Bacterial Ig-like domain